MDVLVRFYLEERDMQLRRFIVDFQTLKAQVCSEVPCCKVPPCHKVPFYVSALHRFIPSLSPPSLHPASSKLCFMMIYGPIFKG